MVKFVSNCFFLSEKRLGESKAHKVCSIAEDCFKQENKNMRGLSWCGNYKIDQQRVEIGDLNYRVIFTYVNDSKAQSTSFIDREEEGKFCKCFKLLVL